MFLSFKSVKHISQIWVSVNGGIPPVFSPIFRNSASSSVKYEICPSQTCLFSQNCQQFHNDDLNKTYTVSERNMIKPMATECQTSHSLLSLGRQCCFDHALPWGLSQVFDLKTAEQRLRNSVFDVPVRSLGVCLNRCIRYLSYLYYAPKLHNISCLHIFPVFDFSMPHWVAQAWPRWCGNHVSATGGVAWLWVIGYTNGWMLKIQIWTKIGGCPSRTFWPTTILVYM